MAIVLWCAWAITLGPAVLLLRGRTAGDLMFKVAIYISALSLGTRLTNVFYCMISHPVSPVPVGYLMDYGLRGFCPRLHPSVLLTIWFCGGLAGHALIYSASMLRGFWTTARNRAGVVFYGAALLVGLCHPLPVLYFWTSWRGLAMRETHAQLDAALELTDSMTSAWVAEAPDDAMTLLLRANFLSDTQRHAEALAAYQKALLCLPQDSGHCRAAIKATIEKAEALLHGTQ